MPPPLDATPRTTVRFARPSDAETIVEFVKGLAIFEREPVEHVRITPEIVLRDGFGERPLFEVLIAEQEGRAVGHAFFFPNYSTWEGRAGLYLEDLYVTEEARGTGAGRALFAALARVAHDRGWGRLDFAVLDWNPARSFYEPLGASHQREWLPYRLDAEGIARLASEAVPPGR